MWIIKTLFGLKNKHYAVYATITVISVVLLCIVNMGMVSQSKHSSDSDVTSSKSSTSSVNKNQTSKRLKKNSENTNTDYIKKTTSSTVNKTPTKSAKADTNSDPVNKISASANKTTDNDSKTNSAKKNSDSSNNKKTANKTKNKAVDTSYLSTTPKSYKINGVTHYNQNLEMPTGCEIVSARMVLSYYGIEVTYDDMLKHIQRADLKITKKGKLYGKTPFQAFIGNPKKSSGFGCYPPVILEMIEKYCFEKFYAESTCNLPLDFIAETYVTQDIPVLVWASIGMMKTSSTHSWYIEDEKGNPSKEKYTWRANEHCLVLIGYDEKYYYFSDPLSYQKVTKYDRVLVEKRYEEVGKNSLIIRERE